MLYRFFLLCVFLIALASHSSSGQDITFNPEIVAFNGVSIPIDMQAESILFELAAAETKTITENYYNAGFSDDTHWLKISPPTNTDNTASFLYIDNPLLDNIRVLMFNHDKLQYEVLSGDSRLFSSRMSNYRNWVFPIANNTTEIFLGVASSGPITIPINLYSQSALNLHVEKELSVYTFFFGAILILAIYNLLIFAFMRRAVFVLFAAGCVVVAIGVADSHGFMFQYFWPNLPAINARSLVIYPSLGTLINLFFVRNLLSTKLLAPKADNLLKKCVFIPVFFLACSLIAPYKVACLLNMFLLIFDKLIIIFGSIAVYRHNKLIASGMIATIFITLCASVMFLLEHTGIFSLGDLADYAHITIVSLNLFLTSGVLGIVVYQSLQSSLVVQKNQLDEADLKITSLHKFEESYNNIKSGLLQLTFDGTILLKNNAAALMLSSTVKEGIETVDLYTFICNKMFEKFNEESAFYLTEELPEIEITDSEQKQIILRIHATCLVSNDNQKYLQLVLDDVTDATKKIGREIHRARHDALTNIWNRFGFLEQLHCLVEEDLFDGALMFIDLDRFKLINDTAGHEFGDLVLHKVTTILKASCPNNALIGRLGGDEFAIFLKVTESAEAHKVGESIISMIATQPHIYKGKTLYINASIGLAMVKQSMTVTQAMHHADNACYLAKSHGKGCLVNARINTSEMVDPATLQKNWIQRLQHAYDRNEFSFELQPISSVGSQRLMFEALIRLKGRGNEVLMPHQYLSIAERHGMAENLDWWMINAVVHLLQQHQYLSTIYVNINICRQTMSDKQFIGKVNTLCEKNNIKTMQIGFEIQELDMASAPAEYEQFNHLASLAGYRVIVDNYGAGVSSYQSLKRMPPSEIKIDGSLIAGIEHDHCNLVYVKSLLSVAQSLGISVIASHVETEAASTLLLSSGFKHLQGFWIGRPATAQNSVLIH